MNNLLNFNLPSWLPELNWPMLMRIVVLIIIIWPLVFTFARWMRIWVGKKYSPQYALISSKLIQYIGSALVLILVLYELGFSLTPLLGAAGIVGVALGFASQTSVANVISGLFLMAEQPFVIGDVITTGSHTGEVLSIDMLSVKLRTFDNRYVRIPNEAIIKTDLINITRFPIRRLDMPVAVAYKENLERVRQVLLDVAHKNHLALEEPEPQVIINGFGASGIDFMFAVWCNKADFIALRNSLLTEVKLRFDAEDIEIPFPHTSIYTGTESKPFPIKLIRDTK